MRVPYQDFPVSPPEVFPEGQRDYAPILRIRLSSTRHSPPTKFLEVWVDSGSPYCYFHANLGRAMGIRVEKGKRSVCSYKNRSTKEHEDHEESRAKALRGPSCSSWIILWRT